VKEVREVHNVRLVELDGGIHLSLHVKLPPKLPLSAAHAVSKQIESAVTASVPEIDTVRVHLEPLSTPSSALPLTGEEREHYAVPITALAREMTGQTPSALFLHREAGGLVVNITVKLDPAQTLAEAHRTAGRLEESLRSIYTDVVEVVVQTEPAA
jgi:divalent metal cation (Fe/Co/Zn/Cd) transporter